MPAPTAYRAAALYDVHGNLPALDAALAAATDARAERLVFGGDVALGPMPRETIARLKALGPHAAFVRGNCDRLMVNVFDGQPPASLPPQLRETIAWASAQLEQSDRDFLASFADAVTLTVSGVGEVFFCHATPRSDEELFTVRTPDERVRPMLDGGKHRIVVCGHTHMQFDRRVDDVRLLNAGSVGMPFGATGAHWLLLGPDVSFRRTPYDLPGAAERVGRTPYPRAAEFAAKNILQPPSEAEMLALFEPKG